MMRSFVREDGWFTLARIVCAQLVLLFSAGCTTHRSAMNNAFDDLVNETRVTSSDMVEYRSFVSVSGLVPHSGPGTIFHHPSGLSPTHGISLSPKWSYVVSSTYPMGKDDAADLKKVIAVRTKYMEAREAIVRSIALQVQLALAERAADMKGDMEFCLAAQRMLSVSNATKCDQAEKNAIDAALLRKRSDAIEAVTKMTEAKKSLINEVNEKNLLVTRWDQKFELTWLGKLAEFFSFSVTRKRDQSGILIIGGIRTTSLKIGEDYVDMVREMDPNARKMFQNAGVDLFQVQAKHLAYISELRLEDAVAASLSLTVDQLKGVKSLLGADDTLETRIGAAMLTDISNLGVLSSPEHAVYRRCFIPPRQNERDAAGEAARANHYQSVYTVRGQIKNLDGLAEVETDLSAKLKNKSKKQREWIIARYTSCANARIPVSKP